MALLRSKLHRGKLRLEIDAPLPRGLPDPSRNDFADPSDPRGSVAIRDEKGDVWSPALRLVPPRLNKTYEQHPAAERILDGLVDFAPDTVTLWGVGLTDSDVDLLEIYTRACRKARRIEYINPSLDAYNRATDLLNVTISHFSNLDDWLAQKR